MRPPEPLPTEPPLITFYTPTYRRPNALARCLASVARQTARRQVEHIVVPDYVGYGVGAGLFGRIPWYADACRGRYVHVLADDDELASESVVSKFAAFVEKRGEPEVVIARVRKGVLFMPLTPPDGPPVVGRIDMASYVMRRDVWLAHVGDYQSCRYESDFDHAAAMWKAGRRHEFLDELFVVGAASRGAVEQEAYA